MSGLTCARDCTQRGRHRNACDDANCTGCLPRLAAPSLAVCETCADRSLEALQALPGLWVDVEDAGTLRARSGGAQGCGRPIPLDEAGAAWRHRARACLVTWCHVLRDDYGISLDDAQDTPAWMAERIARSLGRLLAGEHADQLASDLLGWDETDTDGSTRHHRGLIADAQSIAHRSRGARQRIRCTCGTWLPIPNDDDGRPDPTATLHCPSCGEHGVLAWWRTRLIGDDPAPMTLGELPEWLALVHRIAITPQRLRTWADAGIITPVPTQRTGIGRPPRRYDPIAVAAVIVASNQHRRTA